MDQDVELTETLLNQLKCSICNDSYKDPKVLSCLHIFCRFCIQNIIDSEFFMGEVPCPVCGSLAPVEDNDTHNLPSVVFVNRLVKHRRSIKEDDVSCEKCHQAKAAVLFQSSSSSNGSLFCSECAEKERGEEEESDQQVIPLSDIKPDPSLSNNAIYSCKDHDNEHRELYCWQCSQLICDKCKNTEHVGHKYDTVKTIGNAFKEEVLTSLSPLRELYDKIRRTIAEIEKMEIEITEQGDEIAQTLESSFDELVAIIEERKKVLLKHTKDTVKRKVEALQSQQEELKYTSKRVENYVGFVDKTSEYVCNEEFISMKKSKITNEIRHLAESFKNVDLELRESANLKVVMPSKEKLMDMCQSSSVFSVYTQSHGTGQATTGQINKISVDIVDCDSAAKHSVLAELKSLVDETTVHAEIIPRPPSTFEASYVPRIRAGHHLTVSVNNVEVTTEHIYVHHPPTFLSYPVRVIEDVNAPRRLAISSKGELYVTERDSSRYTVFDVNYKSRRTVSSFGKSNHQLIGIAVDDDDNVYVTSDHKVQKFGRSGSIVKIIGGDRPGAMQEEFNQPMGIKFHNELLYVCDCNNGRIQVYSKHLKFVKKFGSKGESKGQFESPIDIDFDLQNNIYVADLNRHTVLVFDKDGAFVRTIGSYGVESGKLSRPSGLCVAGGYVYVVENFVQRVSVFRVSGEFVCSFGSHGHQMGQFNAPVAIAVDSDGFCYVCDTQNNRIQVF